MIHAGQDKVREAKVKVKQNLVSVSAIHLRDASEVGVEWCLILSLKHARHKSTVTAVERVGRVHEMYDMRIHQRQYTSSVPRVVHPRH